MRRSDSNAAKKARLNAGEPTEKDVATPAGESAECRQLRQLRELDERLEVEGHRALLDDLDRNIIDKTLFLGRIQYHKIGAALELNPSTVWHRIKRLLKRAGYLQGYAETLLGDRPIVPSGSEEAKRSWRVTKALLTAYAYHYHSSHGAAVPAGVLSIEEFRRLNRMQQGRADARRLLYPPIGLKLERRDEKVIITGTGPLDPILEDAVRVGKAERVFDPPRCHACGRYISRPYPTGHPRKWCRERCRSRYRRQR